MRRTNTSGPGTHQRLINKDIFQQHTITVLPFSSDRSYSPSGGWRKPDFLKTWPQTSHQPHLPWALPQAPAPGSAGGPPGFPAPADPGGPSRWDSSHSSRGLSPLKANRGAELPGGAGRRRRCAGGGEAGSANPADVPTLRVIPFYRWRDQRCQGPSHGARGASPASRGRLCLPTGGPSLTQQPEPGQLWDPTRGNTSVPSSGAKYSKRTPDPAAPPYHPTHQHPLL